MSSENKAYELLAELLKESGEEGLEVKIDSGLIGNNKEKLVRIRKKDTNPDLLGEQLVVGCDSEEGAENVVHIHSFGGKEWDKAVDEYLKTCKMRYKVIGGREPMFVVQLSRSPEIEKTENIAVVVKPVNPKSQNRKVPEIEKTRNIVVGLGQYAVTSSDDKNPILSAQVDPGVGLLVYDLERGCGGLAHVDAEYDTHGAIDDMIGELINLGGRTFVVGYTSNINPFKLKRIVNANLGLNTLYREKKTGCSIFATVEIPLDSVSLDVRDGSVKKYDAPKVNGAVPRAKKASSDNNDCICIYKPKAK